MSKNNTLKYQEALQNYGNALFNQEVTYSCEGVLREVQKSLSKEFCKKTSEYMPQKLRNGYYSPKLVNKKFKIPTEIFVDAEEVEIDHQTVQVLKLTQDYVVIYDEWYAFLLDITKGWELCSQEETAEFMKEFDIWEYIPTKNSETHKQYAKRVGRFYDFDYLLNTYEQISQNSDFCLQWHDIEDQFSFSVYYRALPQKKQKTVERLLSKYWEIFFRAFKICEYSTFKWNLILDIFEKFWEEKSLYIYKKLSEILGILEDNLDLFHQEEQLWEFYSGVMWKSIKLLEWFVQADEYDLGQLLNEIWNIESEIIEAWLLFKAFREKGVNNLDDLEKIWIDYKKMSLSQLSTHQKHKISQELISLYYQNYDNDSQKEFLQEIEGSIKSMMSGKQEVDFYMFYVDEKPVLSTYIKHIDDDTVYWWWFNAKNTFQEYSFGFWVSDEILELLQDKNIQATVTSSILWENNKRYKILLRSYKARWFEVWNQENTRTSQFTKIYKEKS